jgi:FG-GAP repeat
LLSNGIAPQHRFGFFIAVDGDLIVGAPLANSVYIYRRDRGVWSQEAKLTGTNRFGRSVAIVSNSAVIVSANYEDHVGPHGGSAYLSEAVR